MSAKPAIAVVPPPESADAAEIVEKFLAASMVPDPATAAGYVSADLKLTFTGGRKMRHPRESAAFNAKRYKWVQQEDGAFRRRPWCRGEPSSTISARSTANGRTERHSMATATLTGPSFAMARSFRWMSGTTAPNSFCWRNGIDA